jgi:hypothetical protein
MDRAAYNDRLIIRETPIEVDALKEHSAAREVSIVGLRCTEDDLRALASLPSVTQLRITGLAVSAGSLCELPTLKELFLTEPGTIEGLDQLNRLESLTLYSFPKIHSLAPIGSLINLRRLHLSTPPGYDASRKCHAVDSLEPIGRLERLEQLVLRGVLPDRDRLDPLRSLKKLERIEITHVYSFGIEDYVQLALALPRAEGHCLQPYYSASWAGKCRRCGEDKVALTAPPPRSPRTLCPSCNRERLARHVASWEGSRI